MMLTQSSTVSESASTGGVLPLLGQGPVTQIPQPSPMPKLVSAGSTDSNSSSSLATSIAETTPRAPSAAKSLFPPISPSKSVNSGVAGPGADGKLPLDELERGAPTGHGNNGGSVEPLGSTGLTRQGSAELARQSSRDRMRSRSNSATRATSSISFPVNRSTTSRRSDLRNRRASSISTEFDVENFHITNRRVDEEALMRHMLQLDAIENETVLSALTSVLFIGLRVEKERQVLFQNPEFSEFTHSYEDLEQALTGLKAVIINQSRLVPEDHEEVDDEGYLTTSQVLHSRFDPERILIVFCSAAQRQPLVLLYICRQTTQTAHQAEQAGVTAPPHITEVSAVPPTATVRTPKRKSTPTARVAGLASV